MKYCFPVWGWDDKVDLRLLDRIQTDHNLRLVSRMPSFQSGNDVVFCLYFTVFFHDQCSEELCTIVPSHLERKRVTRGMVSALGYLLPSPICGTSSLKNEILPRLVGLWNTLSQSKIICFPTSICLKRNMFWFSFSFGDSLLMHRELLHAIYLWYILACNL